jgi:hypothetical protein
MIVLTRRVAPAITQYDPKALRWNGGPPLLCERRVQALEQ